MRSHVFPVVVLSAVAVTATSLTSVANAGPLDPDPVHRGAASTTVVQETPSGTVCARNNGGPNGDGLVAQHFEYPFEDYDARAAADFTLTRRCTVATVDIPGLSRGRSNFVDIQIRRDRSGLPGAVRCRARQHAHGPSFTVPVEGCTLRGGRVYWLAVRVDQDFGTDGQWYWAATNEVMGLKDVWRNPGDAFGTGCIDWAPYETCYGYPYDAIFSVNRG